MSARGLRGVVLLCVVVYGLGLGDVPFYTRGEPREGLVVREMLRTGAWLVPQRPEGEVARKPPLYYWLAAPLVQVLPDAPELALRLPSAALATGGVALTWVAGRAMAGPAAALPAALVLATSFEWTRAATSARIDMTLAAGLTGLLVAWLVVLAGGSRRWLVAAGVGATMATLAKGPVGLVVPALAAGAFAAWRRDRTVIRRLGVVPVLGGAALVAALWYLAAFAEQGRAFFDVVVKENLVRFIDTDDAKTGHAHGFFYLAIVGLVGLLPWVPLVPFATPKRRDDEATSFAAVWTVVVLVFFSVANAKRSVYLLPAFPALALCIGVGIASGERPWARRLAAAYAPCLALLGALGIALAAGLDPAVALRRWLRPDDAHGASAVAAAASGRAMLVAVLGLVTIAAGVMVERARRRSDWTWVVLGVAVAMAGWTVVFDTTIHPAIARTRSLQAFMATVDRMLPEDVTLAASFPTDPGLRFYAPRPLVRLELQGGDTARHLLVWEDEWRRLRDARGEPLAVLAVSDARQARQGAMALVVAPAGTLRRVAPAASPPSEPGLHAAPVR